jgi:hypothetical protein
MGLNVVVLCEGWESAVGSPVASPCTRDTVHEIHEEARDTPDEVRHTHDEAHETHDAEVEVEDMLESVRRTVQGLEGD